MTSKINTKTKKIILEKVKELCVPAHGCTEIGAIGYGVAAASAQVKGDIRKVKSIIMEVSPYIFKNVMRVGVPNLGTCGIFMIGAGAAVIAKPERKLEMFSSITEKERQDAQHLIDKQILHVKIPSHCEPVHVKTIIKNGKDVIESLIEGVHDNLVYVRVNGKDVIKPVHKSTNKNTNKVYVSVDDYKVEDLIDIANSCNEKDLEFLPKLFQLNINISEYGKTNMVPGSYTETYKKLMDKKPSIYQQIILDTAAGIDARMSGAVLPVMSSCGSGDHGLTASIPQFTYHRLTKNSELTFLRSLLLTNLLVWKIKSNIGSLSCMCGSVIAAVTATITSIAYQMKLSVKQMCNLMENLLCTFNSTMCDGAKLSCTHKVCTAMISGIHMIELVKNGYAIKPLDGIIAGDINKTLLLFRKMSIENSNKYNLSIVNGMCKLNIKM